MTHEIIKCQTCETVIARCRCPGPHPVRYVDESLCPKTHGPYCGCEIRRGGILEVDDMDNMVHKTCGKKIGPMPPADADKTGEGPFSFISGPDGEILRVLFAPTGSWVTFHAPGLLPAQANKFLFDWFRSSGWAGPEELAKNWTPRREHQEVCASLLDRIEGEKSRAEKMEELLALILPLAKGYAHEHPVGSNQKYVEIAESAITPLPKEGE